MTAANENVSNLGTAISQGEEGLRIPTHGTEGNQIKCSNENENSTTFFERRGCTGKQSQALYIGRIRSFLTHDPPTQPSQSATLVLVYAGKC